MKRLIGNRAAVFDVTLHYKHRDALAVAMTPGATAGKTIVKD